MEPNLNNVAEAVAELRKEVKSVRPDQEKIERLQTKIDTWEEKIAQPLVLADEQIKGAAYEIQELKNKLETAGNVSDEQKARVDLLELELATRSRGASDQDFREGDEFKALIQWCRYENHRELAPTPEQKALLRTDQMVSGGFLVPTELDSVIVKKITEIDPIRTIARVRSMSGKNLQMPIRSSIPVATFEGENQSGEDSVSAYENVTVTPYRLTHTSPITQDQLMDAAFNMESELTSDAAEAFAFGEGAKFVLGTANRQPQGFAVDSTLQTDARPSGDATELTPNSLIQITGDIKSGYDPVYVLNRRTLAVIRTFRGDAAAAADQAGQYLWNPGMNGPVAPTLNGFRYVISDSMPDIGAGTFPVAFGDFRRAYTIVDRTGTTVIRDDLTLKKQASVEFTFHRWVTGIINLREPLKLLEIAA